eukprot:scaffold8372_cov63-Phaeocystis_antarctica.AAC.2
MHVRKVHVGTHSDLERLGHGRHDVHCRPGERWGGGRDHRGPLVRPGGPLSDAQHTRAAHTREVGILLDGLRLPLGTDVLHRHGVELAGKPGPGCQICAEAGQAFVHDRLLQRGWTGGRHGDGKLVRESAIELDADLPRFPHH